VGQGGASLLQRSSNRFGRKQVRPQRGATSKRRTARKSRTGETYLSSTLEKKFLTSCFVFWIIRPIYFGISGLFFELYDLLILDLPDFLF
jgi:hypothetical protein